MKKLVVVVLLICTVFSQFSLAEMYRWEDKNGVVTFKDTPPPTKKNKVKVYTDNDFAAAPPAPAPSKGSGRPAPPPQPAPGAEVRRERPSAPVEMFVTDWCGVCRRAEQFMASRNYPYVAYNIEKDKAAMKRFRELGGRGVPLILLGSQKLAGFSSEAIDQYMHGR